MASTDHTKSNTGLPSKVLRSTQDWHYWYGMIVTEAMQSEIWQYIDPDSEETLREPTPPPIPPSSVDLSQGEELALKFAMDKYNRKYLDW